MPVKTNEPRLGGGAHQSGRGATGPGGHRAALGRRLGFGRGRVGDSGRSPGRPSGSVSPSPTSSPTRTGPNRKSEKMSPSARADARQMVTAENPPSTTMFWPVTNPDARG